MRKALSLRKKKQWRNKQYRRQLISKLRAAAAIAIAKLTKKERKERIAKAAAVRWNSDSRKSQSEITKKQWLNKNFRNRVIRKARSRRKIQREIAIRVRQRGKYETSIERKVRLWLQGNEIGFKQEARIGDMLVDFLVGDLVIECDGAYWHSAPERKAKDRRRDRFLRSQGFRILRLKEEEINKKWSKAERRLQQAVYGKRN